MEGLGISRSPLAGPFHVAQVPGDAAGPQRPVPRLVPVDGGLAESAGEDVSDLPVVAGILEVLVAPVGGPGPQAVLAEQGVDVHGVSWWYVGRGVVGVVQGGGVAGRPWPPPGSAVVAAPGATVGARSGQASSAFSSAFSVAFQAAVHSAMSPWPVAPAANIASARLRYLPAADPETVHRDSISV